MEGNESQEDESEEGEDAGSEDDEGEDDDDGEEEEEEEGEDEDDDDDSDENEDGEEEDEDDEEEDKEEEAAVACETTGLPGLPKPMALGTTKQSEMADENVNQPKRDMMEDRISGDSPLKVKTDQEKDAPDKMDTKETIPEKTLFGGRIPGILDLEDGCLVSAVRVVSRFSDEEDNEEASDSPSPPAEFETSLPSVDRTSNRNPIERKNENQSDDDDWEDDDGDEDEELLKAEKNILEVERSQGTTIECDPQLQDETDDVPLRQDEGIAYLDTSNLDAPSASPKSKVLTTADYDEDDWDDVDEEEEGQTKKPLNLFLTLLGQKEPESPEVSWESGSDKSDGAPERHKESNMEMPSSEKDQHQEALVQDDNNSKSEFLQPTEHLSQSPLHEDPTEHLSQSPLHEDPTEHISQSLLHEDPTEHISQSPLLEEPTGHLSQSPLLEEPTGHLSQSPLLEEPTGHLSQSPLLEEPTEHISQSPLHEEPTGHLSQSPLLEEPTEHISQSPLHEDPTEHLSQSPLLEEPTGHLSQSPLHEEPTGHLSQSSLHEEHTGHLSQSPLHEEPTGHLSQSPLHEEPTGHLSQSPLLEDPTEHLSQSPLHEEPTGHLSQSPLHEESGCIDQSDESETIPVSMIVGQSDEDQSISQEDDSQVKRMQYDFPSGSVKFSGIDQISDVSDDESMLEEDDGCIDDADQPQTSDLLNSSPKRSTMSSPAQMEKPLLMRSLSNSPKPLNAMSPLPTSPKSLTSPSPKHTSSPRQSTASSHQHATATSPQILSSSSHLPSPQHCSPLPLTFIHLDQDSQGINTSTNLESPQHLSHNTQAEDDLSVEFADERTTEVFEPETALQEEIPYTVIDEVDLTSDSDEEDGEEELEKLHEQNTVNKSVKEEGCSKQGSLQVLRRR